ncbi:hypothetical protein Zmor_007871 [Zophobas morio]|uniref:Uncharacterized protein n=1 Tax=Zophobas morio TaxID=2755281 RepID=A0AA38ITH7_9CUCU|nr:hypothetical protein Zmor_007871 [Zophobas morio]
MSRFLILRKYSTRVTYFKIGRNFTKISDNFNKGLIECVLHHKIILSFVEGCKFFNWIFVCHLIINGVAIGITMFQLTMWCHFLVNFIHLLRMDLPLLFRFTCIVGMVMK